LIPPQDVVEKKDKNDQIVVEQSNSNMDIQFESNSTNGQKSNKNYSSATSIITSSNKTNTLYCNDFDYDDAMEL